MVYMYYVTLNIFSIFPRGVYFCETCKRFMKLDYSFCIVWVCSESQQVFQYMEYLKYSKYNLKCNSNKINKTRLCELRYRPIGTMFFTQEYIYYF